MRSLLITFDYPPDVGGMAAYYEMIIARSFEVTALHFKKTKARMGWLSYIPLVLRRKKTFEKLLVGNIIPLGYVAVIFRVFFFTTYAVYLHGKDVLNQLSLWKRLWIWVILALASEVYANSRYTAERVSKEYRIPRDKIIVEYPRVDVVKIERAGTSVSKTKKNADFALLSVGRLIARKGFDTVIKALSILLRKNKSLSISYWIIGDGVDSARLRSMAKEYNIEHIMRFFGEVTELEIYGYYSACDCFIMPSRDISGDVEGFGIVFLEAAALKKPVIGGQSGGIPEAVEDNVTGLLVDPMDPKATACAIETLISDPSLAKKMGESGYERVKEKFNYTK
ncbi:MAG: glycosyltransferase family 4 protein [Candidatus Jacksonbacteria bacterium]|nr:glycosyltransferase family 4 protein [Candidatus Jacksonbacteria bacterium]